MSDTSKYLPRDLRALCGGAVEDADGSTRLLLFPSESYANVYEVCMELKRRISDPDTHPEHLEHLRRELEFAKKDKAEMLRRILEHFLPRPPASVPDTGISGRITVDSEAKSKMEKAISDVHAGRYDRRKKSKTLKAVLMAIHRTLKNGSPPSHAELKSWGFNDQQATDAGEWLRSQAGPEPNGESLFKPLKRLDPGRPKKK